MKKPWRTWRHRNLPPADTGGREARERAEAELARTEAETEHYRRLARDLRRIRTDNHLAQAFLAAARRGDEGARS